MRLSTSCLPGSWISVPAGHKGHPPQHESKCLTKTSRSQQQHLLLRKHTSSCLDPPVCNPRLAPAVIRVQRNSALTLTLTTQACRRWLLLPLLSPQMDPIQKAVMTHTFGPPMVKTKRPIISCNVCQIRFNSEVRKPTAAVGSNPSQWRSNWASFPFASSFFFC